MDVRSSTDGRRNEKISKTVYTPSFLRTLIDFYEKRGILKKIDATGSVDEIYAKLKEII